MNYDLAYAIGFHPLEGSRSTRRTRTRCSASSLATRPASSSSFVLDCFSPRFRGVAPRGVSHLDIERALPDWEIVQDANPYRLRRKDEGGRRVHDQLAP